MPQVVLLHLLMELGGGIDREGEGHTSTTDLKYCQFTCKNHNIFFVRFAIVVSIVSCLLDKVSHAMVNIL